MTTTDPVAIYVYFKAASAARIATESSLRRQCDLVRSRTGFPARGGLRDESTTASKPGKHADQLTWIEIHGPVPAAQLEPMLAAIEQAARDSGIATHATEGRHLEVFRLLSQD